MKTLWFASCLVILVAGVAQGAKIAYEGVDYLPSPLGGHGPASAAPHVDALTFPASGLSPFNPQCSNVSFGGLLQPNTSRSLSSTSSPSGRSTRRKPS